MILVNAENGQNLIAHAFNLKDQFRKLLHAQREKHDLTQLFAFEVKVFYNTASDFWRMFINLEEMLHKYSN